MTLLIDWNRSDYNHALVVPKSCAEHAQPIWCLLETIKQAAFLALLVLFGCGRAPLTTPARQAHHGLALFSGVALSTSIVSGKRGITVLHIALQNNMVSPVTIVTGLIAGHAYPFANFTFEIALRDGRRFELLCDICGPAILSGMAHPYMVRLTPGQAWTGEIPLRAFLYVDSRDQHLDKPAARGALLTTKLQGQWPELDDANGELSVWRGAALSTIHLRSFSRPEKQWLAAGSPGSYLSQ